MTAGHWVVVLVSVIVVFGGGFVSVVVAWLLATSRIAHKNSEAAARANEACEYMKHNIPELWTAVDDLKAGNKEVDGED